MVLLSSGVLVRTESTMVITLKRENLLKKTLAIESGRNLVLKPKRREKL